MLDPCAMRGVPFSWTPDEGHARHLPPNAPAASGISWVPIAAFCFLWSSAFAAAKIAVRDCPR